MKKVLILGASGMAGHVVTTYLREAGYEVDGVSAKNKMDDSTKLVDLTSHADTISLLKEKPYDIIVNCVGVLVKQSEERKDLSTYLNSYLPHFLEKYFENTATKIIHLSTDCVFSGLNAPYKEDSPYDGELYYDRTKALGEIINKKDLTFRMSIIGPDMKQEGIGLFNWFYAQSDRIQGYSEAMWSGITTIELAKGILAAIEQDLKGLYHLVPSTNISKYELLQLFVKTFERKDITVTPNPAVKLDKTLINTRTDFSHKIPSYDTMIEEMKTWIINHSNLYPHYA